jgi:transcriptional regulator with XRE-family HTH domain
MYDPQEPMSNRTLPNQIRDARTLARLSQEDLAKRVGVARQAVSQWENGAQTPTSANLAALRRELGSAFGSEADAVFSTLQRLHGRSEELAALSRYLVMRQDELSEELARATNPYQGSDADQPEAAVMPPVRGGTARPATPAKQRRQG